MNSSSHDSDPVESTTAAVTRRHLFSGIGPAVVLAAAVPGATEPRPIPATRRSMRTASVVDFGAKGDGVTDDSAAFRAALAAAQLVEVPPGSFRIASPLTLQDGHILRGAGHSGWEPYSGEGGAKSTVQTEIIVDGHLAISARDTNNVSIEGLAIRALKVKQSPWGGEPGYQSGAIGIDIAGAYQFDARGISFHGLETGVMSVSDDGRPAQMPHIGNWIAHDCDVVFRFISTREDFQTVRDARIEGCVAALHCGVIVHARNCDGLRIENVRFYQCSRNSIVIESTPFVSIIGATLFETKLETIILRGCVYATISGAQFARAGYFLKGKLLQQSSVLMENCSDISFSGLIEQPIGRAFTIIGCTNLSINGAMGMPYWTTGNLASHDGVIRIERSRAISVNASFSGLGYWIAVWADTFSADTVSGRIATEGSAGVVRCVSLQSPPLGHVVRTGAEQRVAARSSVRLDVLRILVPAGKALVTRSVEVTAPHFMFEAAQQRWSGTSQEPGGGSLSIEHKMLDRNEGREARYAVIEVGVHNPTGTPLVLPAGHELRLSLALE
jgi:hypothetical protein